MPLFSFQSMVRMCKYFKKAKTSKLFFANKYFQVLILFLTMMPVRQKV